MADIILTVDPTVMSAKADEIETQKAAIQQTLEEASQTVKALEADWESEGSRTFQSKFAELADDVESVLKIIGEYIADLRAMAQEYIRTEASVADVAGGLPTQGVFSS